MVFLKTKGVWRNSSETDCGQDRRYRNYLNGATFPLR
jgi:hypothetical protein